MSTARLPTDAPTDRLERLYDDLPEIPDTWERVSRDDLSFGARAGWEHCETGQQVTIEHNRRPTQMHTPETSKDDTGFNARVHDGDSPQNRDLTYQLGSKDAAYAGAIRFMAKYPDGDFELPEHTWGQAPVEW